MPAPMLHLLVGGVRFLMIVGRICFFFNEKGGVAGAFRVRRLAETAGHRAKMMRRRKSELNDPGQEGKRQHRSDYYSCDMEGS